MFTLFRWMFVLLLCLGGIGLYRGWFSLSSAGRDPDGERVNISVSLDTKKFKADADMVKGKIAEQVAQRVKEYDQTKAQEVK